MKSAFARDESLSQPQLSLYFIPVRLGVRPIGSLGVSGSRLSRQTLEAISGLVAIAIERARAIEQLSETEAERQGCRIYVPSGAIAGLDGIKSASNRLPDRYEHRDVEG